VRDYRLVQLVPTLVDYVLARELTLGPTQSRLRPKGWGRLNPPRLLLEVALLSRSGRVRLTGLQRCRVEKMARYINWHGPVFARAGESL
jgi:hypothetical protein